MNTYTRVKTCSRCQLLKPVEQFGRNRQTPDGLAYYCRTCAALRQAQWTKKNPDKVKQSKERYLARMRMTNTLQGDPYAGE